MCRFVGRGATVYLTQHRETEAHYAYKLSVQWSSVYRVRKLWIKETVFSKYKDAISICTKQISVACLFF